MTHKQCKDKTNQVGKNGGMKMEFWSAEQLRKEFDVLASFYQIKLGTRMYHCRSHAVIIRKGSANQEHPDALIVMANPGSCRPKDPSSQPPIIQDEFRNVPYVVVEDDPTQRQWMRLMKIMNWNVISIINLSDLCAGNMKEFGEKLSRVKQHSYKEHSIFSEARATERELLLKGSHSKIILAWGKDKLIRKLACEACKKLKKEIHIYGLRYTNPSWGFRHPFPMVKQRCIEWLEEMYLQLNNFDNQSEIASTIVIPLKKK